MVSPEKSRQEEEYIEFLKGATEPFHKIIEAWTRTSKIRRRKYMNQDLVCIFAEFPCMKLNTGLQLIEIDFDVRFPDQSKIVFENWPKICAAIVNEVKERNINIGTTVFKDLSVHALMTLSYLFSPTTIKRTRKGDIWRPTRSEVQESFFLHVTDYNTLIDRLAARKSKLAEYGIAI